MKAKKEVKEGLHQTPLSASVSYHFRERDGEKTEEMLVASGRKYPCASANGEFYFGLRKHKRFLPGMVWNGSFIPGILTKHGFVPGITTDDRFQPGIIAMGIFMPGIVVGNTFIPGLVEEACFLPGCFTNDRKFVSGRFLKGSFDSGVIDLQSRRFIATNYEKMLTDTAKNLRFEGYGINKIRRYEDIGGISLAGTVRGRYHEGIGILPSGFITNKWVIPGGFDFDKTNLPHADLRSELEDLGINTSGLDDWNSTQAKFENMLDSLLEGSFGNLFGEAVSRSALVEGLNALGQGTSELIDSLNRDYNDYWASVVSGIQGVSGMIKGGSGGAGGAGSQSEGGSKGSGGAPSGGAPSGGAPAEQGSSGTVYIPPALGRWGLNKLCMAIVGKLTKNKYLAEAVCVIVGEAAFSDDTDERKDDTDKRKDDSNKPHEPDQPSDGGALTVGNPWGGPKPIKVKGPNERGSGITIIQTDTGAMMIVDFDQLREAMKWGPEEGLILGLDPLTGDIVSVIPSDVDPKAVLGRMLRQWYLNPIINPIKYSDR